MSASNRTRRLRPGPRNILFSFLYADSYMPSWRGAPLSAARKPRLRRIYVLSMTATDVTYAVQPVNRRHRDGTAVLSGCDASPARVSLTTFREFFRNSLNEAEIAAQLRKAA